MPNKRIRAALLAAVIVSACGSDPAPTDEAADKASITDLIAELYELEADCARQGPNGIDLPGATSFGIGAREVADKNAPGADAREEGLCAEGGRVRFDPVIADVKIFTHDAAIAYGTSTYEEFNAEGETLMAAEFNWTQVLKRTADGWKIQHTHVAPLFPED